MQKKFHHLARAIIQQDEKVLLAQARGYSNAFLPGGHVEVGESAVDAFHRELMEEIGITCKVGRFIGVLESDWIDEQNEIHHFEVNQIFEVSSTDLHVDTNPDAAEEHLTFMWVPATAEVLEEYNLLPTSLRELIQSVSERDVSTWWSSTLLKN